MTALGHGDGGATTTTRLWYKSYRPRACVQGPCRSGNGDYWVYSSDGRYAARYLGPRRGLRSSPVTPLQAVMENRDWTFWGKSES